GQSEIEKAVRDMVEETTSMIQAEIVKREDDVARSRALSQDKSELFRHFERLFVDKVCLILKYVVSQCFSNQDQTDTVSRDTEDFDGAKPSGAVTVDATHDTESAKQAATLAFQTYADEEPVQSIESQTTTANHLQKPDIELIHALQHQDVHHQELNSQYQHHSLQSSEILASTDKLAECQETITILSKQLQALKMPTASGPPDTPPFAFPGRARRSPTTSHSRSRASSPRPPRLPVPLPPRPRTPQVLSKKDEGE
ncbi:hypothetical protein ACJX0J_009539, partial [Zea mays]